MKENIIWNYFQNNECNDYYFLQSTTRLNVVIKELRKYCVKGDRILNIGVGGGYVEIMLKNLGFDIYSLDPSEESLEKLRNKTLLNKNRTVSGYIQELPFKDDFFNAVCVAEVLEHLDDNALNDGLNEISRVLKKDGIICGTVPYNENLYKATCICPGCSKIFHRWGHKQSFTIESFEKKLPEKFNILKNIVKYIPIYKGLNILGKISVALKYLLSITGWQGSGFKIIFVLRKAEDPKWPSAGA